MAVQTHRRSLDVPIGRRSRLPTPALDSDSFGRASESIARYFGTARFLVIQTVLVFAWITANVVLVTLRWDPYPFILLNLAFSTQAAYAAPLILLAQNRQADRDRVTVVQDREQAATVRAVTDYITVEIADVRRVQESVATRAFIRREIAGMLDELRVQIRDDIQHELRIASR